MTKLEISKDQAKKLIINSQMLDDRAKLKKGKNGIEEIINRLGYIQIDTISAVNRSHHHTLWARSKGYSEEKLDVLQSMDRKIFEYWGHAMSYIPMKDYRYCLPRMKKFRNPKHKWFKNHLENSKNIIPQVIKRIAEEGPLSSKDFTNPEKKHGTWWDWKPAKAALEILFWQGELMVFERRKFQKYYDLKERVLPAGIDTSFPTDKELGRYFVLGALKALGIATEKEIRKFMQPDASRDSDFQAVGREVLASTINELAESGEIIQLKIEGLDSLYFALPDALESVSKLRNLIKHVHLLSPFDNLIIQRDRVKDIFDFNYTLECYVPEPKRKFGYFVLPILWGNEFVGRLDPKADRKAQTLIIRNLMFENNFNSFDELLPDLSNFIKVFAEFNNCKKVVFEKVSPAKYKKVIQTQINKMNVPKF